MVLISAIQQKEGERDDQPRYSRCKSNISRERPTSGIRLESATNLGAALHPRFLAQNRLAGFSEAGRGRAATPALSSFSHASRHQPIHDPSAVARHFSSGILRPMTTYPAESNGSMLPSWVSKKGNVQHLTSNPKRQTKRDKTRYSTVTLQTIS